MKKLIASFRTLVIISSILFFASKLKAQEKTPFLTKSYLQFMAGSSGSGGHSSDIGFQLVTKNNWMVTIDKQNQEYQASNLPADYQPSMQVVLFVISTQQNSKPKDKFSSVNISGGKLFHTGKRTWITSEAGISFYKAEVLKFTPANQNINDNLLLPFGIFDQSSNYTITPETKSGTGGIFKCGFNWAFSNITGIGINTFANVNNVKTHMGFEVKFIIGWMNRGK